MKRIIIVITSVLFIGLIGFASVMAWAYEPNRTAVTIENQTSSQLKGLAVTSEHGGGASIITLPDISAGKTNKVIIELKENFSESSMHLLYKDKAGRERKIVLAGYIENGYDVKIKVVIDSIQEDGILKSTVDEKTCSLPPFTCWPIDVLL